MNPIVRYIKEQLSGFYDNGELMSIIKLVLTDIFGLSTLELYGGKDRSFSEKEINEIDHIIARLKNYEPIQYIIGKENFYDLVFRVTPDVLIPRPETAGLVDWIIEDDSAVDEKVLDVGTGSGCIAISLALNLKQAHVEAWDISDAALKIAQYNALKNGAAVSLRKIDVLSYLPINEAFDIIVSNPPYITQTEKVDMQNNVLDWEPSLALFVDNDDPLLFYRRIATIGKLMLRKRGRIYFEINRAFGFETKTMLESLGYADVEIRKDCFGNDRMIKAVL